MHTFVIDMPLGVKGLTFMDDNDEQIVLLNSRYNYETNLQSALHEMKHKADLMNNVDYVDVNKLEAERHLRR
jgi:hypothetical protein